MAYTHQYMSAVAIDACLAEDARARITVGQDLVFTFDHVFGPSTRQVHCLAEKYIMRHLLPTPTIMQ